MIAASFSVQVVAGWIFSRAYDRLALVTSFLAFAASSLFLLIDKDEKTKQILYLSIIQENYSAEHILTLQENETAIE